MGGVLGMDFEDVRSRLEVWKPKLDLSVQATWAEQRWVEGVGSVGGHEDFDITTGVEAIQLVDDLKHGTLHLVVTSSTVVESSPTDCVHFIEEHDARLLRTRHLHKCSPFISIPDI